MEAEFPAAHRAVLPVVEPAGLRIGEREVADDRTAPVAADCICTAAEGIVVAAPGTG